MTTKKTDKKELSISEKLDQLSMLQSIDSSIDEIKILRGELPLEVQDLEDEVEGLTKRLEKFENEVAEKKENIKTQKEVRKEAGSLIEKYEKDQMKVRNNREFDAINKELEYQKLEIELAEKKIKEAEIFIDVNQHDIDTQFISNGWPKLTFFIFLFAIFCSILNVIGNLSLSKAYQNADSSWLAPIDYSYLLFACFWSKVIFNVWPSTTNFIGILLIASAGVLTAYREKIKK